MRVNELPEWLTSAVDKEYFVLLWNLRLVLVNDFIQSLDHPGNHMAGCWMKVVVGSVDIARHNRGENVSVLLKIGTICDVNQTFSVTVPEIGIMRRSIVNLREEGGSLAEFRDVRLDAIVYHRLIYGICSLIGEYTGRQTRHHFVDICLVRNQQHVIVDLHIFSLK